ncbi:SMI1/KNR4 family protein [Kamptonema formosum]|uniref:SMI1/KNR4 family protein n=1 Tax=Kamptonema formosum TaxID=331992 RepID=UPI000346AC7C|nr:SMI1/KNR4 family protein [Oscillatoria sp. PCC 10802]
MEWSRKRIETLNDRQKSELFSEVRESGYLGYPEATEEQIASAEARLGVILPPSYREFLKASNGLRSISKYGIEFYSTEDLDWYANGNEDWINEVLEILQDPVADEEYFVYGEGQNNLSFRPEYLQTALEISSLDMGFIFLLNPQIVTVCGEWEAWFCSFNSSFGISRYRSFREMMEIVLKDPDFF